MKNIAKILLTLVLTVSMIFPAVSFSVSAASSITTTPTGYTSASDVEYKKSGSTVINWGARGEEATFLTTYAAGYYTSDITYSVLSKNSGGTSQSTAPGSDLYDALQTMMTTKNTKILSYQATRDYYQYTDCVSNDSSKLSSFYSGKMVNSAWDGGVTYNREHVWPNSKCIYDKAKDAADIMMLRPTTPSENGSRGNTAYGESASYFDPGVSVHGDVARAILYMYVRWGNVDKMWGTGGVMENVNVLLKWMQEDPVDTWELARNDSVQSITGVRNVFVDYPEYSFLLFGYAVPNDMQTPSGIAKSGNAGGDGLPDVPDLPDNPGDGSEDGGSTDKPNDPVVGATVIKLTASDLGLGNPYKNGSATIGGYEFSYNELGDFGDGIQMRFKDGNRSTLWNTTEFNAGITRVDFEYTNGKNTYANTDAIKVEFGTNSSVSSYSGCFSTVVGGIYYSVTPDDSDYTFVKISHNMDKYSMYYQSITIYLGGEFTPDSGNGGNTGDNEGGNQGGTQTPTNYETLTIAEALAKGATVASGSATAEKYYVIGTIEEIENTYHGNMTIKDDAGNTIYVYGTYDALGEKKYGECENAPQVGDKVKLLSVIKNFNGKVELNSAWIIEFGDNVVEGGDQDGDQDGDQGGNDSGSNDSSSSEVCNHVWTDWFVTQEPTTVSPGLKFRSCRTCGKKQVEAIPMVSNSACSGSVSGSIGFVFAALALAFVMKKKADR